MRARFNPAAGPVCAQSLILGPSGMAWAMLAIDTGSTSTALSRELLNALGYVVSPDASRHSVIGISGKVELPQIEVKHLALGDQSVTKFPVLVIDLDAESEINGILGLDFLRNRTLIVDFVRGQFSID
jgi:predicted aspartyl protease